MIKQRAIILSAGIIEKKDNFRKKVMCERRHTAEYQGDEMFYSHPTITLTHYSPQREEREYHTLSHKEKCTVPSLYRNERGMHDTHVLTQTQHRAERVLFHLQATGTPGSSKTIATKPKGTLTHFVLHSTLCSQIANGWCVTFMPTLGNC